MIQFFKNLFRDSPNIEVHEHSWVYQYETGMSNTKWQKIDGQVGFSKSDVYKCDCGQWAVKHRSDKAGDYNLIFN